VLDLPDGQLLTADGNRLLILNSDDEIVMELVGHTGVRIFLKETQRLPFFIRWSRVSVPCLMVVGSCQDLMTRLFVCGMWRRDLVSECWKAMDW
jgi:hypothetical protein